MNILPCSSIFQHKAELFFQEVMELSFQFPQVVNSLFWCYKISKEWVTKTFDFTGQIATYPTCQPRLEALWRALPIWFGNTAAAVFLQWHFQAAGFGNTCSEHAWCYLIASSLQFCGFPVPLRLSNVQTESTSPHTHIHVPSVCF